MTEHDAPSTARAEAARRLAIPGLERGHNSTPITMFVEGAGWALAQVREGLIMEADPIFGDSSGVTIKREDALAVVDRLEGKQ